MPYSGDLSPIETYRLLDEDDDAVLVDCRTKAEWAYVGTPDLSDLGKQVVLIEWSTYPENQVDPDFITHLEEAGVRRDQPIAFLCRSGVRSKAAAAAADAAGWHRSYNVAHGFEGPTDDTGHRSTRSGWKFDGLPWRQP